MISGSRNVLDHIYDFWIQKLQFFCSFWIQKWDHFYNFWTQKFFGPFSQFLDPETAVFLRFMDPETAPFLQLLDWDTQVTAREWKVCTLPVGKEATTTLLGDVRFWPCPAGITQLRPRRGCLADLTYPSLKRYTHGNSKGMKGMHPASRKGSQQERKQHNIVRWC